MIDNKKNYLYLLEISETFIYVGKNELIPV